MKKITQALTFVQQDTFFFTGMILLMGVSLVSSMIIYNITPLFLTIGVYLILIHKKIKIHINQLDDQEIYTLIDNLLNKNYPYNEEYKTALLKKNPASWQVKRLWNDPYLSSLHNTLLKKELSSGKLSKEFKIDKKNVKNSLIHEIMYALYLHRFDRRIASSHEAVDTIIYEIHDYYRYEKEKDIVGGDYFLRSIYPLTTILNHYLSKKETRAKIITEMVDGIMNPTYDLRRMSCYRELYEILLALKVDQIYLEVQSILAEIDFSLEEKYLLYAKNGDHHFPKRIQNLYYNNRYVPNSIVSTEMIQIWLQNILPSAYITVKEDSISFQQETVSHIFENLNILKQVIEKANVHKNIIDHSHEIKNSRDEISAVVRAWNKFCKSHIEKTNGEKLIKLFYKSTIIA